MEKEVIQVEIPAGKKAAWVDGFLKLVDAEEEQKKDERPITERVKTFEDACKELGEDHKLVQQYRAIEGTTLMDSIDVVAYFKLRIITAALNEGWVPQFTEDEERWYPYLVLWFKGELEDKSDEWKDERNLQVPVVVGSANYGSDVGVAALNSNHDVSNSNAHYGSALVFRKSEIARFAGQQFTELWANYYTGKEVTSWRNI
nr:MAG: hypothetical protein [Bacteriophage sp.]